MLMTSPGADVLSDMLGLNEMAVLLTVRWEIA
jgi:hypothetical protein